MSPKKCSVTFKLDETDRQYISARATAEDISMSAVVRTLIRKERLADAEWMRTQGKTGRAR